MKMIRLAPVFKDYLWGGTRLKEEFGFMTDYDIIAEAWMASIHKDGRSLVVGENCDLSQYLEHNPGYLGAMVEEFPVLIKLINSAGPLSVQVHPTEEYAEKNEHEHGKTEMWYIMDCDPGAFIYYGVNRELSREQFIDAIRENRILEVLNKVEVKKGDYFLINAGTIHAIGAGILLCEVQQNSNSTYRVYDYLRKDKDGNYRPLHIEKAADVANLKPLENPDGKNVGNEFTFMVDCPLFRTFYIPVRGHGEVSTHRDSFTAITVLDGCGEIIFGDQKESYKKGDTFLVPAIEGEILLNGSGEVICVKSNRF